MTVESIVTKTSKKGHTYYLVVIDGEQLITWSESILNFKGKELPTPEWKIVEKTNEQGQVQKQLIHGDEQKQFQKRPFSTRSPEEIAKQESSMHYAYAKDIIVAGIAQGIIKNMTDATKYYLSIADDSLTQAHKVVKEEHADQGTSAI